MHKPLKHISAMLLITAAVILNGCSSGSSSAVATATYSGNTSPAAITNTNAQSVGVIATEAANEAISAYKGDLANPFGVSIVGDTGFASQLRVITQLLLDTAGTANVPVGATLTGSQLGDQFCGGSVTVPDNFGSNDTLNGTFTYSDLCFDDGSGQIIINGTVLFTETSTKFTTTYMNFTVTSDGVTQSFNSSISCDTDGNTISNCVFASIFTGTDGNVHSIQDYVVIGSDAAGYTVSATVFHFLYGEVTISTTSTIFFGGCGVFPNVGELSITGMNSSTITITFNSDCTFTINGFDVVFNTIDPITDSWP